MFQIDCIDFPRTGHVRVRTAAAPVEARLVEGSLDAVADSLHAARLDEAVSAARREAFEEAARTAARALESAMARIDEARERAVEALSTDAVQLGVEIARQLLKVEIQASNYNLEQIVRATLAGSGVKRGHCVIHVHPDDAALLSDVVFRDETELHANIDIERGSVHVETPRGLLVREPHAALEEIREQLLEDLVR